MSNFNMEDIMKEISVKKEKIYPERKIRLVNKLFESLSIYSKCIVIDINHIPNKEISLLRKEFNTNGNNYRLIFGKNTIIRKTIKEYIKKSNDKNLLNLLNNIKGQCGLLFINENDNNLLKLCQKIKNYQCNKQGKIGMISNTNIIIKNGLTNLEPNETEFLQSMDIPTRIMDGKIGILNDIQLIKENEKINGSTSLLLNKLNKKPFKFNINIIYIYNAKNKETNGEILNALNNENNNNNNDNKENVTYVELIPFKEETPESNLEPSPDVNPNIIDWGNDSDTDTDTDSDDSDDSTDDDDTESDSQ